MDNAWEKKRQERHVGVETIGGGDLNVTRP